MLDKFMYQALLELYLMPSLWQSLNENVIIQTSDRLKHDITLERMIVVVKTDKVSS